MDQMQLGTSSDKKRRVYLLTPDRFDLYWEHIARLLETIPIFADLYSPDWVYSEAQKGYLQLWMLADTEIHAIVVTKIGVYPRARVFEILGVAGKSAYKFAPEMESMFEWLAKEQNCNFFLTTVREGVIRKLRKISDIQRAGIVLMKKIVPGKVN